MYPAILNFKGQWFCFDSSNNSDLISLKKKEEEAKIPFPGD